MKTAFSLVAATLVSSAFAQNKAPVIDWTITPGATPITIDFSSTAGDEVVIQLDGPDSNIVGVDRVVETYQFDCTTAATGVPTSLSGDLTIGIDFDLAALPTSDVYSVDINTGIATVAFCLEAQYLWEGTDATHLFVKISFDLDTTEDFSLVGESVQLETLLDLESSGEEIQTDYLGDAYLCPTDCSEGNYDPLPQGDSFSVCIDTNTAGVAMDSCSVITIDQADYVAAGSPQTGHSLANALDDIFTTIECDGAAGSCCRVTTILDQRWYTAPNSLPDDTPGDLTVTGTCSVQFVRRNLRGEEDEVRALQESTSQSFGGVDVELTWDKKNSGALAKMLAAKFVMVLAAAALYM